MNSWFLFSLILATSFTVGWMSAGRKIWHRYADRDPERYPWNWRLLFDTRAYFDWLKRQRGQEP